MLAPITDPDIHLQLTTTQPLPLERGYSLGRKLLILLLLSARVDGKENFMSKTCSVAGPMVHSSYPCDTHALLTVGLLCAIHLVPGGTICVALYLNGPNK